MTTNIYAYKQGSASAKALALAMGIKRIKHQGSRYVGAPHKTVINWGCSNPPFQVINSKVLNHPVNVAQASCKLTAFALMDKAGVSIPDWTTSRDKAQAWCDEGYTIVVRNKLRGKGGEGIGLVGKNIEDGDHTGCVPQAPLYTKYIKKKDEYRVHVAFGEVIHVQRKARRLDVPDEDVNWMIRNHANGFIYAIEDVLLPRNMDKECINAVAALGLDFGAVDVVYNEHHRRSYVLEVNTAPGLEGTTLEKYSECFLNKII